MNTADNFSTTRGFSLKLGRWDFIYSEANKKLTIPVEMLMQGDYLRELNRASIKSWDVPRNEPITEEEKNRVLNNILGYLELVNKKARVI